MKNPTRSFRAKLLLALSALVLSLSCSKDSDLLSEYAIADENGQLLSDFVIDDVYNISPSGSITIDVLANDNIKDQNNVVITKVSNPALGIVEINEDNTITYTLGSTPHTPPSINDQTTNSTNEPEPTPEPETDTFTYTVETTDEEGNTSTEEGTVTVTVTEDEGCTAEQMIPEYRLNGVWSSGQNDLSVATGTEVMFSMLPNDIGLTVQFPDGSAVGDHFNIGAVTPANSGQYVLTSSEGCTTTVNLTVEAGTTPLPEITDLGELKAFPGAEGFGKYTTGGRGGRVIEVTNLNDSGNGSLRAAIEASGPRTVVFKVAGYIAVQRSLTINNGDITIAGQTAPGDGITIRRLSNMSQPALEVKAGNVIVRGIRIRAGRGQNQEFSGDAASIGSSNIIFDHCSFSWSTDEVIDPYAATNVTFQNCIFSEGLMYSSHEYSTNSNSNGYYNPHSMGMLISNSSSKITIYNSIFAHNNQRNPVVHVNSGVTMEMELVNNVYYNWGLYGTVFNGDGNNQVNLINNLHIPGPNTKADRYPLLINYATTAFARGNLSQYRPNSNDLEWNAVGNTLLGNQNMSTSNRRLVAFDFPLRDTQTKARENILNDVVNNAGAFKQDQVTLRVVQDIRNGTGSLINDPSDVGGYPNLSGGTAYTDSDKDGMSDAWEIANDLNPNDSSDGAADRNDDGFTNLEEFLHYLTN